METGFLFQYLSFDFVRFGDDAVRSQSVSGV